MRARPLAGADLYGLATHLTVQALGATPWPVATEGAAGAGRQVLEMIATTPRPAPRAVAILERHPHSSQSFLALDSGTWLIVLAPDNAAGEPDLARAVCLLAGQGDAICIHRNVWHAPLTVLDRPATFAMTMWRRAEGGDGEVRTLATPLTVTP